MQIFIMSYSDCHIHVTCQEKFVRFEIIQIRWMENMTLYAYDARAVLTVKTKTKTPQSSVHFDKLLI